MPYTIIEYTQFNEFSWERLRLKTVPGNKTLTTTDGQPVNWLAKGKSDCHFPA